MSILFLLLISLVVEGKDFGVLIEGYRATVAKIDLVTAQVEVVGHLPFGAVNAATFVGNQDVIRVWSDGLDSGSCDVANDMSMLQSTTINLPGLKNGGTDV
jgi:hypothetical protein